MGTRPNIYAKREQAERLASLVKLYQSVTGAIYLTVGMKQTMLNHSQCSELQIDKQLKNFNIELYLKFYKP